MLDARLVKTGEAARLSRRYAGTVAEMGVHRRFAASPEDSRRNALLPVADLLGRQASVAGPLTVCYARVSGHDRKDDLERQHATLEALHKVARISNYR